jgi:cytoskeleton protein RodZ
VWWWNGGSFEVVRSSSTAGSAAPASATAAPEPRPAAASAVAPPPELPAAPAGDAADNVAPATATAVPVGARDVGAAPDAPAANAAALPTFTIPLEFTFDQESWTEVTDARGERLLFGLSTAGRRVTVRGEPPFAILLGNANAVRLVVDGEDFTIPTRGRQGDLARFSVDIAEE